MVYLDNAATTYPKPPSVISKNSYAMVNYGANPGRSGHKLSLETAEAVFAARRKCADFFDAEVENVCFMLNCTQCLNTAIKGILTPHSHIITSDLEHNAVARPLAAVAKDNGVTYSVAEILEDDAATVRGFERLITPRTKAIVVTAASNVSGQILPFRMIGNLCRKRGICFILDAAQGAGVLPVSLKKDNINVICAAGHKGLYGPMGTGLMITDGKFSLKTLVEGGTGSASKDLEQPKLLPDRFESGTLNTAGIIALGSGIDFVRERSVEAIYRHEWELCRYAYRELSTNKNVIFYREFDKTCVPLFSFNLRGKTAEETASELSSVGFYLRGGFHCAYFAHKKLGTLDSGTVRFAPSIFTTKNEVSAFIRAVMRIVR